MDTRTRKGFTALSERNSSLIILMSAVTGMMGGFAISLILSRSIWLEMRVNTGHAIPVAIVCIIIYSLVKQRPVHLLTFLIQEVVALLLLILFYGISWATILTVPAALFREAFHLGRFSLQEMNVCLVIFLSTIHILWICGVIGQGKADNGHKKLTK